MLNIGRREPYVFVIILAVGNKCYLLLVGNVSKHGHDASNEHDGVAILQIEGQTARLYLIKRHEVANHLLQFYRVLYGKFYVCSRIFIQMFSVYRA